MNSNQSYFACAFDNSCEQRIGFTQFDKEKFIFMIFSILGIIFNLVFFVYSLLKTKKRTRKASMRRIFLIFPVTDILTSIYWLISSIYFYNLKQIAEKENRRLCSLISCFFIHVNTFQLTLINFILFHFRKINTNPIEGILKPNKKIVIYGIICFIIGAIVTGLSEFFQSVGRSPFNTCLINTKYTGYYAYIYLIPVICIVVAIIQLIHDLFFKNMFNSDKGIRMIHRKNSCYVLIFCILHYH